MSEPKNEVDILREALEQISFWAKTKLAAFSRTDLSGKKITVTEADIAKVQGKQEGLAFSGAIADQALAEAANASSWIPVREDALPKLGECVLTYFNQDKVNHFQVMEFAELREAPVSFSAETIVVGEWFDDDDNWEVTHWMPLPPLPGSEV